MCISSPARAAVEHGYRTTVAADACAARDLPDGRGGVVPASTVHQVALVELVGSLCRDRARPPAIDLSPITAGTMAFAGGGSPEGWRWGVGGAEGNRTPDLLIANEALSQLSYGPKAATGCTRCLGSGHLGLPPCAVNKGGLGRD